MRIFTWIIVAMLSLSTGSPAGAADITSETAVAQSCNDGDTCRMSNERGVFRVRFAGIDAPESFQPFANESRDYLLSLINGKTVQLECNGRSFDRIVCAVYLEGVDVQAELVKQGLAFEAARYSHGKYAGLQAEAREKRLNIWSQDKITSPHCYRKPSDWHCHEDSAYQP